MTYHQKVDQWMQSLVVSFPQYESHQLNRFHSFRLFFRLFRRFSTFNCSVFLQSSAVFCWLLQVQGFSSSFLQFFFWKSYKLLFLVDLYGVYIRVYSMYVPVLVVLDMDDECLSSYGSRRGFFFGVSRSRGRRRVRERRNPNAPSTLWS